MNISLICFTRAGFETMKRINDTLSGASEAFANASCPEHRDRSAKTEDRSCEGGTLYQFLWIAGRYALQLAATDAGVPYQAVPEGGLSEWTKEAFLRDDALIFVGACGIAVRSIAPYVRDKFQDPAVVCVDEAGQFVIPLLSGHVGGANRLAEMVASGATGVPRLQPIPSATHRGIRRRTRFSGIPFFSFPDTVIQRFRLQIRSSKSPSGIFFHAENPKSENTPTGSPARISAEISFASFRSVITNP